jgi:hypothetical protein
MALCVLPGGSMGLEGAAGKEQQLDVRLERVEGRDPALVRQSVEKARSISGRRRRPASSPG